VNYKDESNLWRDMYLVNFDDGAFTISAGDKYEDNWLDDDAFRWQIACHTGFEDLYDGELPNGISGEVLGEAIAKPEEIFQIYDHIQKNKSSK
jgi:hypothetical protein